ncbi:hypothetical protein [Arcticibacter sp. MXS-1]|uniref:hypothetical protein n=1 Tax=Arcticibacter sp. MXS-1 TaxID=3341726 RepID=UPI0035A8C5B7
MLLLNLPETVIKVLAGFGGGYDYKSYKYFKKSTADKNAEAPQLDLKFFNAL